MNALTLLQFLVGRRDAILRIASSRGAMLCAVLFVISAGFAREYDGEDLLHEPWHLLRPLGASLVSGTLLFLLVHTMAFLFRKEPDAGRPAFLRAYGAFMTLFWMTAPLAWLYAIPWERMVTPVAAVEANLWTLALVSIWRVILITRVVSVIYGVRFVPAFFVVMLFADAVAFAAMSLMPAPIIDIMGGLRHTERDALVAGVTFQVQFLSVLSAPVWLIGAFISMFSFRPNWQIERDSAGKTSRPLLLVAAASIVIWLPFLSFTQPEQMNRRAAERLLRSGRIAEAFAMMSSLQSGDFPPHWNPPPRMGYRDREPDLQLVREAMREQWPADWVAEMYLDKIERELSQRMYLAWDFDTWAEAVGYFEGSESWYFEEAAKHADSIQFLLEFDRSLTDGDRAALQQLLQPGEAAEQEQMGLPACSDATG